MMPLPKTPRAPILTALLAAALLLGGTLPGLSHAADAEGYFAYKGVGNRSCGDFLVARKKGDAALLRYVGWVEGFLSAGNLYESGTFDIAPWQTQDFMISVLALNCRPDPSVPFHRAVSTMMQSFHPARLTERSEVLLLDTGQGPMPLYSEVLQRVRQRLVTLGKLQPGDAENEPAAMLGDATRKALEDFQNERGLPVTGMPGIQTLAYLFTDIGSAAER
jgi:peptidoglycan hydrolase-like protein with peptidoglycan-binding domain